MSGSLMASYWFSSQWIVPINIDLNNGGAPITLRMLSTLNQNFLKPIKKLRKGQAMFGESLVPLPSWNE